MSSKSSLQNRFGGTQGPHYQLKRHWEMVATAGGSHIFMPFGSWQHAHASLNGLTPMDTNWSQWEWVKKKSIEWGRGGSEKGWSWGGRISSTQRMYMVLKISDNAILYKLINLSEKMCLLHKDIQSFQDTEGNVCQLWQKQLCKQLKLTIVGEAL